MKRILITLSLLLPSLLCGAQEEVYVETRPGAEIFQISRKLEIPSDRRLHYDYSKDRKKKDKKGGRYLVTGLANRNRTPGYDTYIVVKGDTLFKISRRYGVTVDDLVRWNGIKNRNLIHPGQQLKIY